MQPETMATVQPDTSTEEAILREVADVIGRRRYEHWFQQKTHLSIVDDEVIVGVANPFLLNWLQKHFRTTVLEAAQSVLGPSARIRFEVNTEATRQAASVSAEPAAVKSADPAPPVPQRQSPTLAPASDPAAERAAGEALKPRSGRRFADLADFVEGRCNQLALTAVRQVCDHTAEFSSLFLHGPVGTGKTHLLEAIYRQIRRRFPTLQVVYLTSEAFTNYFTQALREHTLPSFRQRFRSVDILLIDDIDFLDSKRVIQEEFLHTFKQLESYGRQIIVASDRHPRLLTKLSDELKTRFLSGMVCRLEPPDFDTRLQIVERKAAKMSATFSAEALNYVAQRFKSSVRELEGALHCLQTYAQMTGKRIGLTAARQVLADLERDCIKVVRLADIEQAVCDLFRLQADELKSAKRSRSISQPRMLAMYLARKHTRAAYSEIGQYFGGRDHSTVMSAEKKIDEWLRGQASIRVASDAWPIEEIMETLEQQLQAG